MIGSRLLTVGVAGLLGFGTLGTVFGTTSAKTTVAPASMTGADFVATTPDTAQVKLAIKGMTCGSCATTARVVLERTAGVIDADVSYEESSAEVTYDTEVTTPLDFIARLEEMTGYEATIVAEDDTSAES